MLEVEGNEVTDWWKVVFFELRVLYELNWEAEGNVGPGGEHWLLVEMFGGSCCWLLVDGEAVCSGGSTENEKPFLLIHSKITLLS